jgi:hypothetical protein
LSRKRRNSPSADNWCIPWRRIWIASRIRIGTPTRLPETCTHLIGSVSRFPPSTQKKENVNLVLIGVGGADLDVFERRKAAKVNWDEGHDNEGAVRHENRLHVLTNRIQCKRHSGQLWYRGACVCSERKLNWENKTKIS